jgi:hypothetical protein
MDDFSKQQPFSPSPCLTGSAYERSCIIVRRCGSDPGMERNGTWKVHCPAHDDRSPSLRITHDGEKVLAYCYAGCSAQAICAAIGITLRDLFSDDRPSTYSTPASKRRKATPPDNIPLQFAVSFLVDDPAMLEVDGLRNVLRAAHQVPSERLWVERELSRHGMTPAVGWKACQMTPAEFVPHVATKDETGARVATRIRKAG